MRRLSILHTESSMGWGGQEIRILTEARGMIDRGHGVTLATPRKARIFEAARDLGIPVEAVELEYKGVPALLELRRWLGERRAAFDVINTHSSTDSWLTALVCATLRDAPPIVRTRHVSTGIGKNPFTRWLYLRAVKHIVITGEALRQSLARSNGFPLDHMTSVRTGIDLQRYRPLDQRECRARLGLEDAPTLGIVATIREWKGHRFLLDAMKEVHARHPEWRLVIVGDGSPRPSLEARVAELGLQGVVRFLGNRDDVPQCMATFDLFVLPSFAEEGVPQAIMQAMACGLAVVSTPVGAIGEAVQDGLTGHLVAPRDAAALAKGLLALIEDPERRSRMARAGREYALAHFGIDEMLNRMEAIFRRYGRPPQGAP